MALTDFKLDGTGDLDLSSLAIKLESDVSKMTAQRLKIRLRMIKGEWFLNTSSGVPYLSAPFTDKNNKPAVDNIIKTKIIGTEGIISLNKYSSEIIDRHLKVSFEASTEGGSVISILDLEIF